MKTMPESISPERARKYLDKNKENRSVRDSAVERYANQMKLGRWMLTHQGICFSTTGRLLDGQHRLLAIVRSGCTVTMNVTRDADEATFRCMDVNIKRTAPDLVKLVNDPAENKSCCQIASAYCRFAMSLRGQMTIDDMENAFLEMSDAVVQVAKAFRQRQPLLTRATVGAAVATYLHKEPLKAAFFLDAFITGANLSPMSPVLALRNALLNDRIGTTSEEYWKSVSAIKAHSAGKAMKNLTTATEDLMGNTFFQLAHDRANVVLKGLVTAGKVTPEEAKRRKRKGLVA